MRGVAATGVGGHGYVQRMTSEDATRSRLIVLDTETTGLDRFRHQPWEVAWCDITPAVEGQAPLASLDVRTLLLPHTVEGADPEALRIGRYAERCTGTVATLDDVRVLWSTLGGDVADRKHKPIIIGSNPAFDQSMLGGLFHRHGLSSDPWYQRSTDVSDIARFGLGWVSEGSGLPLGLGRLSERLGVCNEDAHTAASDVRATCEVYLRLTQMLDDSRAVEYPPLVG